LDFGIQHATTANSWKVAKRAEELGFTHAWFYDTQLLNAEMFAAMGAAAMQTSRIRLGTGVLVPSNRIAPVAASGLATLNALAPGRIDFAVGTGFTGRRTMGLRAISWARLEEYVCVVQGLLAGETVEWSEEGGTHKIRFLNPEIKAVNIDDAIPLHVSAFGPKGRKLTAKLGAGWMGSIRNAQAANANLADMQAEWKEAGRSVNDLYASAISGGCVLREGETFDSPRVKAQAGPAAAIGFHAYAEADELGMLFPVPPPLQARFDAYREVYRRYQPADARYLQNHRGHLMFLRPEEHEFITGDVIRGMTFSGTASYLVEQLQEIKRAGYRHFAFHARHGHETEMLEDWAEVVAKV
jgi:5,10-methylenetetrahydromethanopterin reductase